jgi:hypothetical protein
MILQPGVAKDVLLYSISHENKLPLKVVGAVLILALSSMLFLIEAEGDPKGASRNLDLPRTGQPQRVP